MKSADRKKETRVCKNCGAEFQARVDHKTVYCSRKCYGQSIKTKAMKRCPICGKEFMPHRSSTKFCSNKCGVQSRSMQMIEVQCAYCKSSFNKKPYRITENNFCSKECQINYSKEHPRSMENHPRWNNGKVILGGYIFLKQPDCSYKPEHRIVVETAMGRKLRKNEIIHHIDENKQNNCIENLTIMNRKDHCKLHAQERWDADKVHV